MLTCAICGGAISLLTLTTIGPTLIAKWTAGKVIVAQLPMLLFGVSIAFQGIWAVGGIVLVCSNMHHLFNYLYLGVTLAGLALASVVTPILGFTGVPATMVLQDTALTIIAIVLCQSKLSHIRISDVGSVFTLSFYRKHIKAVRNKLSFASSK